MTDSRNHRELLKKYMRHVAEEEGVTFVNSTAWKDGFTDLDSYELRLIEQELKDEVLDG